MKNIVNKNIVLFSLCFVVFLDFLGYGLILPVLTPLFLDPKAGFLPFNYSENTRTFLFGLVTASYAAAQFFGAPIIGSFSDKYGRKKMLMVTLFGTVLANSAFIFGTLFSNVWIMVFGRLAGGFMGGNAALANTMVGDISEPNNKTRNYGFIGLAMALGIVLGPYLGAQLSDPNFIPNASLRTPFYFSTTFSIITLLFVYLFVRETLMHKINIKRINIFDGIYKIIYSMQSANLRAIFSMTFLVVIAFNLFVYSLNIFLFKKLHFSEKDLGNYLAYAGICLVISLGLINPYISKYFKTITVLKYSLLGLSICFFLALFSNSYQSLYFLTPFLALCYGLSQANIASLLSNNTKDTKQGESFGVNQSITSLVEGITPILCSFLLYLNSYLGNMFAYMLPTFVAGIAALNCAIIFYLYFVIRPQIDIN